MCLDFVLDVQFHTHFTGHDYLQKALFNVYYAHHRGHWQRARQFTSVQQRKLLSASTTDDKN